MARNMRRVAIAARGCGDGLVVMGHGKRSRVMQGKVRQAHDLPNLSRYIILYRRAWAHQVVQVSQLRISPDGLKGGVIAHAQQFLRGVSEASLL